MGVLIDVWDKNEIMRIRNISDTICFKNSKMFKLERSNRLEHLGDYLVFFYVNPSQFKLFKVLLNFNFP